MKQNGKILIPTLALSAMVFISVYGSSAVYAAVDDINSQETLIQKIADEFNLDKNDVESIFDDFKIRQQENRFLEEKKRLDRLVDEGAITRDQRNIIFQKFQEMRLERKYILSLPQRERAAKIEEYQKELKNWVEENKLDLRGWKFFMGGFEGVKSSVARRY